MSPEDQSSAINVSHQFRVWCGCGAILCALTMVYGIMGFIFQCTKNVTHAKFANCFLILGYCMTMAWLVCGSVIRYKKSGKACSGDDLTLDESKRYDYDTPSTYNPYQLRTGTLMATMLLVMYCFYGCLFCCGLCACMAVLSGYRRELM